MMTSFANPFNNSLAQQKNQKVYLQLLNKQSKEAAAARNNKTQIVDGSDYSSDNNDIEVIQQQVQTPVTFNRIQAPLTATNGDQRHDVLSRKSDIMIYKDSIEPAMRRENSGSSCFRANQTIPFKMKLKAKNNELNSTTWQQRSQLLANLNKNRSQFENMTAPDLKTQGNNATTDGAIKTFKSHLPLESQSIASSQAALCAE